MDFFKVEVMTLTGPVRYTVLVVMDLKTRRVQVAGIVREAYEEWMIQIVRHLTDAVDGFLIGKTCVIMDSDPIPLPVSGTCSATPERHLFVCRVVAQT